MKLPHRLLIVVGLALAPISALQVYSAFRLEEQQTLATFAEARRLLQLTARFESAASPIERG